MDTHIQVMGKTVQMSRKSTAFLLMAVGAVALALGCYLMFFVTKGYVATTAVIERVEIASDAGSTRHEAYVRYTVGGSVYHGKSDVSSAHYSEGQKIKIFYNPNNPEQIHGDTGKLGAIFMGMGIVVAVLGVASLKTEHNGQEHDNE